MQERKGIDEVNVARRFISVYNKQRSTDFGEPYKPGEDISIDAEAVSSSDPSAKLKMQVVKSDFEPWERLRKEGWFERKETGFDGVCDRLWSAIEKKAEKYSSELKRQTILLLDGWPGVLRKQVEVFKARCGERARAAGFAEIWFVGWSEEMIIPIVTTGVGLES